jgi:hypothetical protein
MVDGFNYDFDRLQSPALIARRQGLQRKDRDENLYIFKGEIGVAFF